MPIYKMRGKKDGLQQYRVRINFVDAFGTPRQIDRVAYGADNARQLEAKLQAEYRKGNGDALTVQALFDEYIAHKRNSVRETTLNKTERILRANVLPYVAKTKLNKLDMPKLINWKNNIAELSTAIKTKQNIYGEFRALLNYAVRMGYIPSNPLHRIGNFRDAYFKKPQDKRHYYTAEQFSAYKKAALRDAERTNMYDYYVFFCIAFYTGMRKGEIHALKWTDIDGNILHVRRSVAQKVKGKSIVETPPKNKSSYRDLQIPVPLSEILTEQLNRQKRDPGFSDNFRVCGAHKCLSDTALDNKNRQFAADAGLERIRIHDFRHSHASLLANEGINIQEISRRLGHSNVEITWNTYSHLYPREEERAVSVLNGIK